MWLSSYQLLIHYQSNTGKLGVHYNRSNRTWDDGEEFERLEGYDFTRFAAWLIAATKAFAKLLELPISIQPRLPWAPLFDAGSGVSTCQPIQPILKALISSSVTEGSHR